ncbi:glycosyltransferase [Dysgonomonas sp. ZJ709]|uniref:glycosyltransferase n=1 Tax=Dysgonomonas sp. ZJ709 TaxID=2709797 RepID=UPI002101D86C|nr:glycosyltransferase [Dysgonomonas sp. ZJ709]
MTNEKDIMVSICMVTYNHEKFIAEAIDSIVMQQTNFQFELIIGEDCGPDKTREICIAYQQKYPEIIKLNFQDKNVGAQQNFMNTYNLCKGKYIALCEGDDYWTDMHKLQKQVDFLEQHSDFVMCAHASQTYMDGEFKDCTIDKSVLTFDDIIAEDWGIMTASILFKKEAFDVPEWFTKIRNGDFGLQLLLSIKGKIGYLSDNMSVYRQHPGGISATLQPLNQAAWLSYLLYEFDRYTNHKYKKQIRKRIKRLYNKQIYFAKYYHLRKARVILTLFQIMSPIIPFAIKDLRK